MALGGFGSDQLLRQRNRARHRREAESLQLPLGTETMVGRTDPATSADAARKMRDSGRLAESQARALALVCEHPGKTAPELGAIAAGEDEMGRSVEWHRQAVGRRLSELERAGLVYRSGTANGCSVWWRETRR